MADCNDWEQSKRDGDPRLRFKLLTSLNRLRSSHDSCKERSETFIVGLVKGFGKPRTKDPV